MPQNFKVVGEQG